MIPVLQEVIVKLCIGHAGMCSGAGIALGANILNFSICEQEKVGYAI